MNTKKNILTLLLLFIFAGFSFAQNNSPNDTINQYNERGQKSVYWEIYDDN